MLPWKFDYIDRNGNGLLSSPEEFSFQLELFEFVGCETFFDHVSELMDVNNDANISYNEWTSFFQVCESEGMYALYSSPFCVDPAMQWDTHCQVLIGSSYIKC